MTYRHYPARTGLNGRWGEQVVPEPIRQLVLARLSTWVGQEPRLSDNWIDSAIETLPASQRPQARLALLAAFASYQVNARVLDEARAGHGSTGDAVLVTTAAWASFATARQIGSWLDTRPAPTRRSGSRRWGRG